MLATTTTRELTSPVLYPDRLSNRSFREDRQDISSMGFVTFDMESRNMVRLNSPPFSRSSMALKYSAPINTGMHSGASQSMVKFVPSGSWMAYSCFPSRSS